MSLIALGSSLLNALACAPLARSIVTLTASCSLSSDSADDVVVVVGAVAVGADPATWRARLPRSTVPLQALSVSASASAATGRRPPARCRAPFMSEGSPVAMRTACAARVRDG